jgi:hypothetical protein
VVDTDRSFAGLRDGPGIIRTGVFGVAPRPKSLK